MVQNHNKPIPSTQYLEGRASGALQHNLWKSGEQQQITTAVKQLTSQERLQNKIWDSGGNIQTYD